MKGFATTVFPSVSMKTVWAGLLLAIVALTSILPFDAFAERAFPPTSSWTCSDTTQASVICTNTTDQTGQLRWRQECQSRIRNEGSRDNVQTINYEICTVSTSVNGGQNWTTVGTYDSTEGTPRISANGEPIGGGFEVDGDLGNQIGEFFGNIGEFALDFTLGIGIEFVAFVIWLVTEVFVWITTGILAIIGYLFDFVVTEFVIEMGKYITAPEAGAVREAWTIIRDLANIAIIGGLVATAVGTIIGNDKYNITKTLARLILAALLVNFSYFFAGAIIDFSNFMAKAAYDAVIYTDGCEREGWGCGPASRVMRTIDFGGVRSASGDFSGAASEVDRELLEINSQGNITEQRAIAPSQWATYNIMMLIFLVVTMFVFLSAISLLVARFLALIFILVTSPIGIAGMTVPILNSYASEWWKSLWSQAMFAPVYFLLVGIALNILDQFTGTLMQGPAFGMPGIPSAEASLRNIIGITSMFIVAIGFMWVALSTAKKMSAEASRFKEIYDGVQKYVTGPMGGFAWRNTAGRAGEWLYYQYENRVSPYLGKMAEKDVFDKNRTGVSKWLRPNVGAALAKGVFSSGADRVVAKGVDDLRGSKPIKGQKSFAEIKKERERRSEERTATESTMEKRNELLKGLKDDKLKKELGEAYEKYDNGMALLEQQPNESDAAYRARLSALLNGRTRDQYERELRESSGLEGLHAKSGRLAQLGAADARLAKLLKEVDTDRAGNKLTNQEKHRKYEGAQYADGTGRSGKDADGKIRRVLTNADGTFKRDAAGNLIDAAPGEDGKLAWTESSYEMKERLKKRTGWTAAHEEMASVMSDLDPRAIMDMYHENPQLLVDLSTAWTADQAKSIMDNKEIPKGIRDAIKNKRYANLYDTAARAKARLITGGKKRGDQVTITLTNGEKEVVTADVDMYSEEYGALKEHLYYITRNEIADSGDLLEAAVHNKELLENDIYADGILSSKYDDIQKDRRFTTREKRTFRRLKRNRYQTANETFDDSIAGLADEESTAMRDLMTAAQKQAATERARQRAIIGKTAEEKNAALLVIENLTGEAAAISASERADAEKYLEERKQKADKQMAAWMEGKQADEVAREMKQEHLDHVLVARHMNVNQRSVLKGSKDQVFLTRLDRNAQRVGKGEYVVWMGSPDGQSTTEGLPPEDEQAAIDAIREKVSSADGKKKLKTIKETLAERQI